MPLLQVRVCEVQVAGAVTEADWYAVTEAPSAMVPPHGRVQEAGATAPQETVFMVFVLQPFVDDQA